MSPCWIVKHYELLNIGWLDESSYARQRSGGHRGLYSVDLFRTVSQLLISHDSDQQLCFRPDKIFTCPIMYMTLPFDLLNF